MKKFKIIFLVVGIFNFHGVYSQSKKVNSEIERIKADIEYLKEYKTNVDSYSKAAIEKVENQANEKVQAKLDTLRTYENILYVLGALGLTVSIYGICQITWGIKKKIDKQIHERIEDIVERHRDNIIQIVETELFDNKLRNTKTLLVIGGNAESNSDLRKFLEKMRFKKVVTRIAGADANLPEHDLIIFNTPNDELDDNVIRNYLQDDDESDTFFVAYSHKQRERHPRLNFANSRITLYHNIFLALKYMEIVKTLDAEA